MSGPLTATEMLPFSDERHMRVDEFMVREAELLDNRRYRDWLALLTDDIVYRMPVRVTAAHSLDDSVLRDMDHFDEDRYSLEKRIERFETEHAFTEDPPSRTRHLVTNLRTRLGEADGELHAQTYVLVFRSRLDVREPDWLVGERSDILREVGGLLRLARRDILIDESVLRTQNLAIFI
jgi:3-phenylpropionate/cinnamic acid dioxygenase small subunit